ncbi:MAG: hypothetical protein KAH72_00655 [Flavobacteriaceae bacterium]|nr:hypothetical protein [Flavobacteriaceae bacterium]
MSNLYEIVNSLDNKLTKLLQKHNDLQRDNKQLLQKKSELEQQLLQQHQLINDLEQNHESLKIANAIVGSKEDKHLTKLKINTLIREIDKCIVQLSD